MSDTPSAYNLKSLFEKSMRKHRERPAVQAPSATLTYGELEARANALAHGLVTAGIEPEDRIAILMSNRIEYVIADIAIIKAGATKVPLNDMLTDKDIKHIIPDSGAKAAITDSGFIDVIKDLYQEVDHLKTAITTDDQVPQGFISFDSLIESGEVETSPEVNPAPSAVAAQYYTGGTTGKPKGVVHTHRSLSMNAYSHIIEFNIRGDDKLLLMTPLPHSAGMALWGALLTGATTVVESGFAPERALERIENEAITWSFLVPTMIYRLLDCAILESTETDSLRTIVYGAAPMTPGRLKEGLDAFGPIFLQLYGQTEVPNLISTFSKREHELAITTNNEHRLESAGQPCLMSQVRILDRESGNELSPGEIGEIVATAPYTMSEYFGLPDATEETLTDGWIHTGDIGRIDEEGYLYLLDRENDIIITGGMNVYSTEVEDLLEDHPEVRDVAVIGVPHEDWGEAVHAIVEPYEESSLTEEEVISQAKNEIATYKVPKKVLFVDDIPTTPYGKHDKVALRDRHWKDESRDIA
jgi:fatty-acyl-CoA synthase/long-chain acyl-CoA synthetase